MVYQAESKCKGYLSLVEVSEVTDSMSVISFQCQGHILIVEGLMDESELKNTK